MAVTQSRDATKTRTEKGISLARGPALIVGTILLAAGLYFLYRQHNFPKLSNFPNGKARVDGKVFWVSQHRCGQGETMIPGLSRAFRV